MGGCNHDGLRLPLHQQFCHDFLGFQTSLIKVSGTSCHPVPVKFIDLVLRKIRKWVTGQDQAEN